MIAEDVARALLPINCFYHYEIRANGKCYDDTCMMNTAPDLKEKIKEQGCGYFNSLEIKDKCEIEAYRLAKQGG